MRLRLAAIATVVLLVAASLAVPGAPARPRAPASDAGIAQRRAESHLRRGINLSKWFAGFSDPAAYTKEHFETAVTPQDIALIRTMGFDSVRLSVDPRPMFRDHQADQIASDDLARLDAALQMLLAQNLAVDIGIYADDDFKNKLATSDEFVEEFADFWRALARHWSGLDPDRVFFEILNEPEGKDSYRWYGVEAKLADAIREGAPNHTIIATGAHWSDDDDLVFLEPLRDPNVIYAFHFYEAHVFTHQGATWSTNYWHSLKGVPYPSTPENVQPVLAQLPDRVHRLALERYGMDRWNAARIDGEIAQVAAWASHWNVPVICNEFGVYRKNADPGDRAAWIADTRASLEKHGIGWAMWDYDGGFGVVDRVDGKAAPDEATVRALGLAMPGPPK
ncbi:MAG TPA: cellulase family glycosylhydrolase [Candidatus Aquilonibacter sp.]|nr:cellulase family glycosylhydrolase [Candidatus Aquilonibacter sp.]